MEMTLVTVCVDDVTVHCGVHTRLVLSLMRCAKLQCLSTIDDYSHAC